MAQRYTLFLNLPNFLMIIFLPHPSSPAKRGSFENHPPSPSLASKKGLHRFPLNPLSPQGTGDLKPGRPGLYSQTSSRPVGVARELPTQQSCECLTHDGECLCAEGAAAQKKQCWLLIVDYWLMIISIIWDGVTTLGVTGKCFRLPVTRKESSILNETS